MAHLSLSLPSWPSWEAGLIRLFCSYHAPSCVSCVSFRKGFLQGFSALALLLSNRL